MKMRIGVIFGSLLAFLGIYLFSHTVKDYNIYTHGKVVEIQIKDITYSTRLNRGTKIIFDYNNIEKKIILFGTQFNELSIGNKLCLKHNAQKTRFMPCGGYETHFILAFSLYLFVLLAGIGIIFKSKI